MKRILITLLAMLVALIGYVAIAAWRSPPVFEIESPSVEFPLMSWDDYQNVARSVTPPVIDQRAIGDGAVLIFGAEHRSDPDHPQFVALDAAYAAFDPDVVLVEGRMGFFLGSVMDPIRMFGESGAMAAKAKRDGRALYTWEMCRTCEPEQLAERFSDRQVALFLLLRPYSGSDDTTRAAGQERISQIIADRRSRPGIEDVIGSLDDFEAAWEAEFQGQADWHTLGGIYGAPGFLHDMFEYANDIRDQNLLNIIRELTDDGQRVMATVGWSHAVRIAPALRMMAEDLETSD